MPQIAFISDDGSEHVIEAKLNTSVMENAVQNAIPGIDADCRGNCTCATCHVFIDLPWSQLTGIPNDMENAMLDFVTNKAATSRLSCQIKMTSDLDGLIVRLPASQG